MTELIKFDNVAEMPNIIKVIGVGGGGSNAVTHMFTEGIKGVDFILCNTDHQALEKSPVAIKVHLGKRNLGAGNVPAVGRDAALDTIDEIKEILGDDTKMLFITAGMGGGTGTGAAPVVASVAKELGVLTVGIVTLPFSCEGKRRQQQALEGIAELRKHVDTLLIISNDKLRDEYGDMKLTEAFKKADDVLKTAAKGIAEIITVTGYVNVDFQDVNTVMRNSGKAIMGSGYADGDDRALHAVEEAVHSPLLNDSDITGAKNILIYITSGSDEVSLDEVMEITEYVQDATGNCSEVIWGNGEDLSLGTGINVTLIATGFNNEVDFIPEEVDNQQSNSLIHDMFEDVSKPKNRLVEPEPETTECKEIEAKKVIVPEPEIKIQPEMTPSESKKTSIKHSLYDEDDDDTIETNNANTLNKNTKDTSTTLDTAVPTSRVFNNPFNDDDDDNVEIKSYVKNQAVSNNTKPQKAETPVAVAERVIEKTHNQQSLSQQEILRRNRLNSLNMSFKNPNRLEELENQPAFKRMGIDLNDKDKEDEKLSRYSSSKNMGLREDNSFLHDNVD